METVGYAEIKETLTEEQRKFLEVTTNFQAQMRDAVRMQLFTQSAEQLSQVAGQGAGDVSYRVDKYAEDFIDRFGEALSRVRSVEIISEGVGNKIFPSNAGDPEMKVLVDPVDGTRGIMYDLYSAWVETGIAKNKGEATNLSDIDVAVMTEIPTTKQGKGSVVWAAKGRGAYEEVWDLEENKLISVRKLQPSRSSDLLHGFSVFADPFSTSDGKLADFRSRVLGRVLGEQKEGFPVVFNDQVLTSAGQIYDLASGKYRFFADLMPYLNPGELCTHPYDLAGILVAQEAGVIITDSKGGPLSYPLDTDTNCGFIGYANQAIKES